MARRYYDTPEKVFKLLKTHPSTSNIIVGLSIADSKVMDVANYLLLHHSSIISDDLKAYYNDSDMIDDIAALYGFDKPYDSYVTSGGESLVMLLNTTLYIYKFGSIDNFYEKHIFDFIPEYDRDQILDKPKMKLTIEGLGRKLDQIEDQISRFSQLYDIDQCPDEFLDYLGQNIGYEREDYSLSSVSFRELLKNIIEIYKVKGTNYSFSFFFKFLGFEINLKEFYFNRDVENPESFPGMSEQNVEYFLTTKNPTKQTGASLKPAHHLDQSRNLDDWKIELTSLKNAGCTNPVAYMRGNETYNNDGITWHSNPWTYFKTNLIEYKLDPFTAKLNLTASDNETIKKYVRFLSPTYLFTWINVNLAPWIEDTNIIVDSEDNWLRELNVVLGDPRPTATPWPAFPQGLPGIPYHNPSDPWVRKTASDAGFEPPYEDFEDMLTINLFQTNGENLMSQISKQLNYDQTDQWGTVLCHNGEHYRQPGNPKHVANAYHRNDKRLCFDSLELMVKSTTDANYIDYSANPFPKLPGNIKPYSGQTIANANTVQITWDAPFKASEYWVQIALNSSFEDTDEWRGKYLVFDSKTSDAAVSYPSLLSNDIYYWRIRSRNTLSSFYDTDQESLWTHYTYDSATGTYIHNTGWGPWSDTYYFNVKVIPFPYNNEIINRTTKYVATNYEWNNAHTRQLFKYANFSLQWEATLKIEYYQLEITSQVETSTSITYTNSAERNFINGDYSWRYRALYLNGTWTDWSEPHAFTVSFPDIS